MVREKEAQFQLGLCIFPVVGEVGEDSAGKIGNWCGRQHRKKAKSEIKPRSRSRKVVLQWGRGQRTFCLFGWFHETNKLLKWKLGRCSLPAFVSRKPVAQQILSVQFVKGKHPISLARNYFFFFCHFPGVWALGVGAEPRIQDGH